MRVNPLGCFLYIFFHFNLLFLLFLIFKAGNGCHVHRIPIKEIVTVAPYSCHQDELSTQNKIGDIEMTQLNCSFVIHAIKRMKHHKWRTSQHVFECQTSEHCQQWMDTIQNQLDGKIIR